MIFFLIAIMVVIFVRSKLHNRNKAWLAKTGYIFSLLVAAVLLHHLLRDGYLSAVEDMLATGVEDKSALIPMLGKIYGSGNPLLLSVILFVVVEISTYLISKRFLFADRKDDSMSGRVFTTWWANVIVFLAAPAIVFNISSYSSGERGLDVVSSNLLPVLALYGAPAYWLNLYSLADSKAPAPNAWPFSPRYPSRHPGIMGDYSRDILPWLLVSIFATIASCLNPNRTTQHHNLKQLFFGSLKPKEALQISKFRLLPWRGMYLLVYFSCSAILAGFAILLQVLEYGIILFFYGGFLLIIPMFILWVIYLIYGKK